MKADDVRAGLLARGVATILDRHDVKHAQSGDELRTNMCPTCGQRSTRCVAINISTGAWSCHAHGCKGGILDLVAGYGGIDISRDFNAAMRHGAELAGIADSGPRDYDLERRLDERRRADEALAARRNVERLADMPARYEALSRRSLVGERYLAGRQLGRAARAVRFSDAGDPALPLRDLETGAIVGIQYRCLVGDRKLSSEKGSQVAGSALLGRVADIDAKGFDVAIIVEGFADTLAALLMFPTCAVFGAPGAGQMARIAAAVAPRIAAARGWLLLVADDDDTGIRNASDAIVEAVKAGLRFAAPDAGMNEPSTIRLVDIGEHHDLADAHVAGWRYQWPGQVAS